MLVDDQQVIEISPISFQPILAALKTRFPVAAASG
jgi:hypothetical protein